MLRFLAALLVASGLALGHSQALAESSPVFQLATGQEPGFDDNSLESIELGGGRLVKGGPFLTGGILKAGYGFGTDEADLYADVQLFLGIAFTQGIHAYTHWYNRILGNDAPFMDNDQYGLGVTAPLNGPMHIFVERVSAYEYGGGFTDFQDPYGTWKVGLRFFKFGASN
jgi:hypothetical protein